LGRRFRLAAGVAGAVLLCTPFARAPQPVAAAEALQVVSSSQWGPDAGGYVHIVGEVKNVGSLNSEFNRINFNFYDGSGTLLKPDFTYATANILTPGEVSPFHDIFTPPAGYDHYTIPSVSSSSTGAPPNHNFTTQITNQFTDVGGYQHIVGSITNNNNTADTYVEVVFTFYDCSSHAIDADFTFINGSPPTLAAGGSASFELIRSPGAPAYTAFGAFTQSSDPPSPFGLPARTVVASVPGAPTGVTALAGDGVATVRWTAPLCNGGSPITGFTVTSSPGGLTVTTNGSRYQASLSGLTDGTPYTFAVTASNQVGTGPPSDPSNSVTPNAMTGPTFYFAEGFTAPGFQEYLSLLMPDQGGTAQIDYYTQAGHLPSVLVPLTGGHVVVEDVNADVGRDQQVSARVKLPFAGVVERTLHFRFGSWHGSTDIVGVNSPSTGWYFAEGSTLAFFNEYLTLQNPNPGPANVTLTYYTDSGATPVRTLTLPGSTRTTVAVFDGTSALSAACSIDSAGNAVQCGAGPGIAGVSVQLTSDLAIIAERPFYVQNFSFGSGGIADGHVAFGANSPGLVWNFAEGTTIGGFNEYLTLENPSPSDTTVDLRYFLDNGKHPIKTLVLPKNSRTTVEVFRGTPTYDSNCSPSGGTCGVGPGIAGVSVQVTSRSQPIVAERPIYMVRNFGSGAVAGAHVAMGATGLSQQFSFGHASTMAGDHDFLTIQNSNSASTNVTARYYLASGVVSKTVPVGPTSRLTIAVFDPVQAAGPGYLLGIVLTSDLPVLVEKPTYGSNASTYGATDTVGYSSSWISTPQPAPPPVNVNNNPWGYNFDNAPNYIYSPDLGFCTYFPCIPSFWNQTNGYVEECQDGDYSHSGGVSGSCSSHGGNLRPLYLPY